MNTVPYPKEPKTDPLVRAIKQVRSKTAFGQLEKLLHEEGRWRRKVTLASNKLKEVREEINRMAVQLARECPNEGDVLRRAAEQDKRERAVR